MKLSARLLLLAALAVYGLSLAQWLNITSADIGRHVKNGELLLTQGRLLSTNFYSYTEPEHPAINHHWGSGAIFYVLWKLGGFSGLHLAFIALSLTALLLIWRIALPRAGPGLTALIFVLVAPLLAERRELRPEVFSYLFTAWFLYQLWRVRDDQASPRALWSLPVVAVVWVNTHIYFCLGPALIGAFLLEALCYRDRRLVKPLAGVLALTVGATLLNPFGVPGALAPLTIFQEYGYRVLENQPVWFLEPLIPKTNFLLFKLVWWTLIASVVLAWALGARRLFSADTYLALGAGAMGWLALRNFALFGFMAFAVLASNVGALCRAGAKRHPRAWTASGAFAIATVLGLMLRGANGLLLPISFTRGLGVQPGNELAARFVLEQGLDGPIFNNYDIGGYLIFHLFPRHRVFVDNRPEAYSVALFRDVYVPMQSDETVWRQIDARYGFNAIIFQRHDATPWAQRFLVNRVRDPFWAPVFVDDVALILVRRVEHNAGLIRRFEIPQQRFTMSTPSTPRAGIELRHE